MDTRASSEQDQGFTLIELLVVIVILGVLATVVVFAVGGVVDRGEVSALAGDAKTLEHAEESHYALHGEYATETELVEVGLLRDESDLHDIAIIGDGDDYTIAEAGTLGGGSGDGGDGGDGGGAPESETTTTTIAAVPVGYAGFAGQATGTGSKTLIIIGKSAGTSTADLYALLTSTPLPDTRVIWLDQNDINETDDVETIIDAHPTYMVAADSVPITSSSGGASTFVGQYMDSRPGFSSPEDFWWTHGQGRNPTNAELASHLGV